MRTLSALLVLLSVAGSSYAQTADKPDAIIAQENAFWKAYSEANTADLSKLFSPEFINVEEQLMNRDQVLVFVGQFHQHCTLAPVKLLDPHVVFLSADVATVVYHATETPTCGNQTTSGDTNITTVWVRRNGRWQMHLHTEYAVPPK